METSLEALKVQFTLNKAKYSISVVDGKTTFWRLHANKKLGRCVASSIEDAAERKKIEGIYNKMVRAIG